MDMSKSIVEALYGPRLVLPQIYTDLSSDESIHSNRQVVHKIQGLCSSAVFTESQGIPQSALYRSTFAPKRDRISSRLRKCDWAANTRPDACNREESKVDKSRYPRVKKTPKSIRIEVREQSNSCEHANWERPRVLRSRSLDVS